MVERIKRIIKEYGLTYTAFAEKIHVSRSTVTHILNQRSGPGKKTIDSILVAFPDVSTSWFYNGEEPMFKKRDGTMLQYDTSSPPSTQLDLFNENKPIELPAQSQVDEYSQKKEDKTPEYATDSPVLKDIIALSKNSKKIDKIIFFYDDKSCTIYTPGE